MLTLNSNCVIISLSSKGKQKKIKRW
ncbi:hypothetical protein PI27_gp113 [Listeria phage WIL-1]|nr:hypothetical protein PI27_gp113 [Listeria phage WIL-1]